MGEFCFQKFILPSISVESVLKAKILTSVTGVRQSTKKDNVGNKYLEDDGKSI